MYLLDTDHISLVQRVDDPLRLPILQQMVKVGTSTVYATVVSFHEQAAGLHAFLHQRRSARDIVRGYRMFSTMLDFYSNIEVLPFDERAQSTFDGFTGVRGRVAIADLRIAAIVIANDMMLVTRNRVDFERVAGLRIVDWTRTRDETVA